MARKGTRQQGKNKITEFCNSILKNIFCSLNIRSHRKSLARGMVLLDLCMELLFWKQSKKMVRRGDDREKVRNLMGGHWIDELEKRQWI